MDLKNQIVLADYLIPRIEIPGYKMTVPTELQTAIVFAFAGFAPGATKFTDPAELKNQNCIG